MAVWQEEAALEKGASEKCAEGGENRDSSQRTMYTDWSRSPDLAPAEISGTIRIEMQSTRVGSGGVEGRMELFHSTFSLY